MRILLVVPIGIMLLLAIGSLFLVSSLYFFLWLFAAFALSLAFVPAMNKDTVDKYVPVPIVFSVLGGVLVIGAITAFYDFRQAGVDVGMSILFAVGTAVLVAGIIIALKGN